MNDSKLLLKKLSIRCPRLGHQVDFAYCRQENKGLPCFKALDCWHVHFPVAEFLRQELSPGEWDAAFVQPKTPKLSSLLGLIQTARDRNAECGTANGEGGKGGRNAERGTPNGEGGKGARNAERGTPNGDE